VMYYTVIYMWPFYSSDRKLSVLGLYISEGCTVLCIAVIDEYIHCVSEKNVTLF